MDDTFRNIVIGLGAFLVLHVGLEARARHAAERQVFEAFDRTGSIHAAIKPYGLFGLEFNDLYAVEITGTGMRADRLPFYLSPKPGWKGSIRHLRLRLVNFTLSGLPITRLTADIPDATYDLGYAFYRGRLVLRGAGRGSGCVWISADGLRAFILRKYDQILSDVNVSITSSKLQISGRARLFGAFAPLEASGTLLPRQGRYIDLIHPLIKINGAAISPGTADAIIQRINPVLDLEKDVHLSEFFTMEEVKIEQGEVIISGQVGIPVVSDQKKPLLLITDH